MNTIIKAQVASKKSSENAEILRQKELSEAAIRSKQRVITKKKARIAFYKRFMEYIGANINTAIEYGNKSIEHVLAENSTPVVVLNGDVRKYLKDHYLKTDKYAPQILKAAAVLRRAGYTVTIEDEGRSEDGTAAYMNSGGECGFEGVRHYTATIFKVSWK